MKTMFVPAFSKIELKKEFLESVERALKKYKNIGLVSVVQYAKQQQTLQEFLLKKDKKVVTSYGKHSKFKGQILICDVAAATKAKDDADCFIYLGTGKFHATIVAFKTEKPVICADPVTNVVFEISERDVHKYFVRRTIARDQLKQAKKIGILVSTKPGQANLGRARMIRNKLKEQDKKVYIFVSDTLVPEELVNFPDVDIWVNTSCTGLFDDYERFDKPVINMEDME